MGEPTDVMAEAILDDAAAKGVDRVVAIGGGTVIDIAKVLAVGGGESGRRAVRRMAPELPKARKLVIIPTTCGTGSEVTNISILNRTTPGDEDGSGVAGDVRGRGGAHPGSSWRACPIGVFATSSIDALVHAVESYLSPNCEPVYRNVLQQGDGRAILRGYCAVAEVGQQARLQKQRGLPACQQLRGHRVRQQRLRGSARDELSARRRVPYPARRGNHLLFADVMCKYQEKKPDGKLNQLEELLAKELDVEPVFALEKLYSLMDDVLEKGPLACARRHGGGTAGLRAQCHRDAAAPAGQQRCRADRRRYPCDLPRLPLAGGVRMDWRKYYKEHTMTPEQAVSVIHDGDRVVFGHAVGEPIIFQRSMARMAEQFHNVEVAHMVYLGSATICSPAWRATSATTRCS